MGCRPVMSIDSLSDDDLLEIFDFCVIQIQDTKEEVEAWQPLVHVCQRWRSLVFGSARRLNLRLFCDPETQTRVRDTLDVWPPFLLFVKGDAHQTEESDNIIAPLERSNRVYYINLVNFSSSQLENILTATQKPFPELTILRLMSFRVEADTVVPDLFLGGSTPRLWDLQLGGVSFPGLPKLLLSATHLNTLHLTDIPHSGYFSPEALIASLSTLTHLSTLCLRFRSPRSRPEGESRPPPPLIRTVFPVLFTLTFKGVSEYLEDLVARIDAPRLGIVTISFFNQIIFDTPLFAQFIRRTPGFETFEEARLVFKDDVAGVKLSSPKRTRRIKYSYGQLEVKILCSELDWQVSSLEQACISSLPCLSLLEDLYIYEEADSLPGWNDTENALWLQLLQSFSGVKNLYLSRGFEQRIAPALQELVGDQTAEVLPALQNIFLENFQSSSMPSRLVQEGIVQFIAARELSGFPISISSFSRWESINGMDTLLEILLSR